MKNTKKTALFVLSVLMPATTMPCVFTVTNDSNIGTVYLVTDPNIAESVQQATLNQMLSEDIVKVDNAGVNRSKKTKHNMWFFVYTPNKQKGTYDRTYKISINYCSMEPGANELTIQQIQKGIIPADKKCDRYVVTNFKNNRQKEACGNIVKPAVRDALPAKCHTEPATPAKQAMPMQAIEPAKCHTEPAAPKPQEKTTKAAHAIEKDYPAEFLSSEEIFPDTLP